MGYNGKIRDIAGMLILGTFLVQPGNLIQKLDKCLNVQAISVDLLGSSCHGTDERQHFRNQYQQKKMLACNARNSDTPAPCTIIHTAFVSELQHHQGSLQFLGD
jgi:hypothetical protein